GDRGAAGIVVGDDLVPERAAGDGEGRIVERAVDHDLAVGAADGHALQDVVGVDRQADLHLAAAAAEGRVGRAVGADAGGAQEVVRDVGPGVFVGHRGAAVTVGQDRDRTAGEPGRGAAG